MSAIPGPSPLLLPLLFCVRPSHSTSSPLAWLRILLLAVPLLLQPWAVLPLLGSGSTCLTLLMLIRMGPLVPWWLLALDRGTPSWLSWLIVW